MSKFLKASMYTTGKVPDFDNLLERNKEQKQETLSPQIQDIELLVQNSIDSLSPRELSILRYINQSLMNMIIKHESLRNGIMHILGKDDIFSVILDERNTYLTQAILKSDEDKIFITYGMMHFEGVYELLKESDPTWRIISQKEYEQLKEKLKMVLF